MHVASQHITTEICTNVISYPQKNISLVLRRGFLLAVLFRTGWQILRRFFLFSLTLSRS